MTSKGTLAAWMRRPSVVFALILCFWCDLSFAARKEAPPQPERFMSRTIVNITPEQALKYLSEADVGTASKIPSTNVILVTAEQGELGKAKAILELVDSNQLYAIRVLPAVGEPGEQPLSELLDERIENISIGSFREQPGRESESKAIVDMHKDSIVVVGEDEQIQTVISALEDIIAEETDTDVSKSGEAASSEPADVNLAEKVAKLKARDTNAPGNDKFFNGLLESLAEAERAQAGLKKTAAETKQPLKQQDVTTKPQEKEPEPVTEPAAEEIAGQQPELKQSGIIELEDEADEPAMEKLSYEPAKMDLAEEMLELDLPEVLNIVDLIDLVGKHLDLDLLYDPAEVKGVVSLRVQDKIKVGELYPLLESVLKFRGFVMSRKGNLVTIVPASKVLEIDPVLLDGGKGPLKYGDVIVTRVFDLRYIDTGSAENLLKNMKLGVNVTGVEDAGKLIVTGYAYRMRRVEELLRMIDRPGETKQFRFRQLKYTMAESLASQIETLAEQLGTVSVTVAEEAKPAPAPRRGRRRAPRRREPAPTPEGEPSAYLDADERTNRILMIGTKVQLDTVEKLIDALDVKQQDLRTLRLYDIQYVGAEEVMNKLAELSIVRAVTTATRRTGRRITAPRSRRPGEEQAAAQEEVEVTEEGLVERPLVVIIESTNSLLVNATAEQHAQIATIIAYVDAEPEQAATNYIVYPLENQDPTELAGVLNQLIQETIEQTQGEDSKVVRTTQRKIEEDITIIPDPKTYSLVVYASKKNQQWISSLIEQLDEYRPQVLLDVTLVEITQNEKFEYDLDVISKTYGGLNLRSSQVGTELEDFTTRSYADLRSTSSATDAVIKAFFDASKVQALLTAIEQEGYGRIMARPKLLVNDNQEGEIKTQNTISVAQVKSNVVIPDQGSAVTTKDVTFNDYEAGVTLTIKPHISKGDMLRLEITLNRTDFTLKDPIEIIDDDGKQTFPSPPDRLSTDVTTVGTVPNGTTIILGGLETIDQSKGQSKVPLLGDLPLVGGLFRGVTDTGDQSRLYVFVRANIIRPGDQVAGLEDIRRVSEKSRRAFEEMEERFQGLEDWPGIKPKPMDPVKILEED